MITGSFPYFKLTYVYNKLFAIAAKVTNPSKARKLSKLLKPYISLYSEISIIVPIIVTKTFDFLSSFRSNLFHINSVVMIIVVIGNITCTILFKPNLTFCL